MDMQERIAARRREIERNRLAEEAVARIEVDRRDEDERVRERATAARASARAAAIKARNAERVAPINRATAASRTIPEAARNRWTTLDRLIVGIPFGAGLLLLSSHPIWAISLMLLGAMLYSGAKETHRKAVQKDQPELADPLGKSDTP